MSGRGEDAALAEQPQQHKPAFLRQAGLSDSEAAHLELFGGRSTLDRHRLDLCRHGLEVLQALRVHRPPEVAPVAAGRQHDHAVAPDRVHHLFDVTLWKVLQRLRVAARQLRLRTHVLDRVVEGWHEPRGGGPQHRVTQVIVERHVIEGDATGSSVGQEGRQGSLCV